MLFKPIKSSQQMFIFEGWADNAFWLSVKYQGSITDQLQQLIYTASIMD